MIYMSSTMIFAPFGVILLCVGLIMITIGVWLNAVVIGEKDTENVQFIGLIFSLIGLIMATIAILQSVVIK